MAKIQYNKTCLLEINKNLKIRKNALPVLQSKEAALRAESKRIRVRIKEMDEKIALMVEEFSAMQRLWAEFPPHILKFKKVNFVKKKIASVDILVVENVIFEEQEFSLFAYPAWFLQGIELLKRVIHLKIVRITEEKILESIDYARRKTTQKVNLYEKVQIPFFEEAILKIKRFLEDQDNLSKASQKVIKKRMEALTV
ncbi:MAG: V-type ATP synthase subunit D [Candidatus Omnitrophota bacterium]|nr:MAG: V-type ATP synthase subunit D [Candidatus Omnitrophota bacterium]